MSLNRLLAEFAVSAQPSGPAIEVARDAYQDTLVGGTDPEVVSARASDRVLRGGVWDVVGGRCRSAVRHGFVPANRLDGLGFRVAAVQSR